MKKLLAIAMAAAILLTMVAPTTALAAVDYSYVRVRLDTMEKPSSVQFKVAGAFRIAEASGVDLYPKITYTLKTDGAKLKLTYHNGKGNVTVSLPATVTFVQYSNGTSSNFLYLKNTTTGWRNYAGNMTFRLVAAPTGNYIELVNKLFIETYLYGVVSGEMANDWPAEALKAQAIAARTYAMANIKSKQSTSSNYDIVDTSVNQVYRGYPQLSSGAPQANVINAVNATRGMVLMVGDNFADGMYSASNGGQVRTLTMRYGAGVNTYHVFKDDPYDIKNTASPKFTFLFPRTAAAVSALGSADQAKANLMLDLIKDKVVAALAAQGVTCAKSAITINAITNVTPTALKPGMPAGSLEYTGVAVTVNVTLGGVTLPAPAIAVTGSGQAIANGSATPSAANGTDFGGRSITNSTVPNIYTISNSGNAPLTISSITVEGDNAADFTVSDIPTTVAASNGTATFKVTFDPSAVGDRVTTVKIVSNDATSPYQFRIKGMGLSDGKSFTSFKILGLEGYPGTIDEANNKIDIHVPNTITDLKNLVAVFETSAGATVTAGSPAQPQVSGTTASDFSSPITYHVIAQDGSSRDYIVSVIADVVPAGGGGAPADATTDITVTLSYVGQAGDGSWTAQGELRTKFASCSTLLPTSNLWLLYGSSDAGFFYVTARGYGHGVGLSQRGAQQMANEGKSCAEIIDFYYNTAAGKSSLATVGVTEMPLPQIPGKGSGAAFCKVNASNLSLRAAAHTKGTLLTTLPRGAIVEVLSKSGSWSRVLYPSKGLVGYVSTKYLNKTTSTPVPAASAATPTPAPTATPTAATATPAPTSAPPMGKVLVNSLYIRAAANKSSAIVYKHLHKGDRVVILDANAAPYWYKVQYASCVGYAMYQSGGTKYIELVGTAPTAAPTATAGPVELTGVTAKAKVSGTLTIRKSTSTSSTKLGAIKNGESFTVLQVPTNASWLKVKYSNITGYVLAKYCVIGGSSSYKACTVTASALYARSGAGSAKSVLGTLKAGDTLVVMGTVSASSTKWYKVKLGSTTAYIDYRYARICKK